MGKSLLRLSEKEEERRAQKQVILVFYPFPFEKQLSRLFALMQEGMDAIVLGCFRHICWGETVGKSSNAQKCVEV